MDDHPSLEALRLGKLLADRRKQAGITQDQAAMALGMLRTSISNIEHGRQTLSALDLLLLAGLYSMSLDAIQQDMPQPAMPDQMQRLALIWQMLSESQKDCLLTFAQFLESQRES